VIQDASTKEKLVQEWHFVRRYKGMLQIRAVASFGGGSIGMVGVYNEYYAVLLVLGFSVIEHALRVMHAQRTFNAKGWELKRLMEGSKSDGLVWKDYDAVDAGREARNGLAHRQTIPKVTDTFRMLDEIEAELIGWNIVPGPVSYEFSLSVSQTS
jgi:hypothetical protein